MRVRAVLMLVAIAAFLAGAGLARLAMPSRQAVIAQIILRGAAFSDED